MPIIHFRPINKSRLITPDGLGAVHAQMLASGVFTMKVKNDPLGNPIAVVNDILRLKGFNGSAIVDNWLTVNSRDLTQTAYTTYSVTRNSGTVGTLPAGTAVVNYKQANQGWIYQTADDVDGPFFSVRTHAGAPWTTQTERVRVGNLRNTFDYGSTPTYGFSAGVYASSNTSIAIESTNGIRIFNGTTQVAQWDTSGNITIGRVAASQFNTYISGGALSMRVNTTPYFQIDTSGNVTLGNVATNQGNVYWDATAKQLKFRGGASGTATQAYVDTTGAIVAGGGDVRIDANGVSIGGVSNRLTLYSTNAFSTSIGGIVSTLSGGNTIIKSSVQGIPSSSGAVQAFDVRNDSGLADIQVGFSATGSSTHSNAYMYSAFGTFDGLVLGSNTTPNALLDVRGSAIVVGGLNVGSASGAATGEVKASGDVFALAQGKGLAAQMKDFTTKLSTGVVTMTTAYQDVTGCTMTFTPTVAETVYVWFWCQWDAATGTATINASDILNAQMTDSVAGALTSTIGIVNPVAAIGTPSGFMVLTYSATAAAHTLKMQAKNATGARGTTRFQCIMSVWRVAQ